MTDVVAVRGQSSLLAVLVVMLLSLSACGGDPAPAESAPGLAKRLERVDEAIAARDYDEARSALDGLAAATAQAQADGRITTDQADEIVEAVSATLRALDTVQPEPAPPDERVSDDDGDGQSEDEAPQEVEPTVGDDDDDGGKGKGNGKGGDKGNGDGKGKG